MHERTQRAVARLLFVFCCAVPTTIVFTSILFTWTSWYQTRKLDEVTYNLSRETGLVFEIGDCQRIAPGKYVLNDVRIADPDSGRNVATIRMVDYFHEDDHVGILLHQPELQSSGLGQAWSKLHDRLISAPAHTALPITIVAKDVNIFSRAGSVPPLDLTAKIRPEGKSVRMIAQAANATANTIEGVVGNDDTRIQVELFRDREGDSPATEVVVSTEGTALPCSALADFSPAIQSLGPDALFSGMIKCVQSDKGWSYDLGSSTLSRINLSLLTQNLPHHVSGNAEIQFRGGAGGSVIAPGELVNLTGTVKAEHIRLRPALLAAMQKHLAMNVDPAELVPNPIGVECSLAAIDFRITDETMELLGTCGRYRPGIGHNVALWARGRAIAKLSSIQLESDNVTAMLMPPGRWLAAWNQVLLPSSSTSSDTTISSPEIRRVKNWTGGPTIKQR